MYLYLVKSKKSTVGEFDFGVFCTVNDIELKSLIELEVLESNSNMSTHDDYTITCIGVSDYYDRSTVISLSYKG